MISMPDLEAYLNEAMGKSRRGPSSQASVHSPPYPDYDYEADTDELQQTAYKPVRQPAAEDFCRKDNVLTVQPVNECASTQEESVNEPESPGGDSHPPMSAAETHIPDTNTLSRSATVPSNSLSEDADFQSSPKEEDLTIDGPTPSLSLAPTLHTQTLHDQNTVLRVSTMGSDTFSTVLGGLHSISGMTRKESKRERVKRCWKDMKCGLSFWGR